MISREGGLSISVGNSRVALPLLTDSFLEITFLYGAALLAGFVAIVDGFLNDPEKVIAYASWASKTLAPLRERDFPTAAY